MRLHEPDGYECRSATSVCRTTIGSHAGLGEVGELIEAGRFWLPVDKTFPLASIAEAHRVSEHGRVRGRLVLVVD